MRMPVVAFCFMDLNNWVTSLQSGDVIHYDTQSGAIQFMRGKGGRILMIQLGLDGPSDRLVVGKIGHETYYAFVKLLAIVYHAKGINKMSDGKLPDYVLTI